MFWDHDMPNIRQLPLNVPKGFTEKQKKNMQHNKIIEMNIKAQKCSFMDFWCWCRVVLQDVRLSAGTYGLKSSQILQED